MDSKAGFQVLSLNGIDAKVRNYQKRKAHRKTNSGCLTCKGKKVKVRLCLKLVDDANTQKCDELRPVCARCERNGRLCVYGQPSFHTPKSNSASPIANPNGPSDLSILSAVTVVPFSSPSAKDGTSSINLLQHFQRYCSEIFHTPRADEIISLSKTSSLLHNTVLALTASHLRHASPGVIQHRIAEYFQQCLALQDYQRAINTPPEKLGQSGVDALLLSGALLSMLAFTLPETETAIGGVSPDQSISWVFSPREDRLNWLALQVGLKPLMISISAYLDQTLSFLSYIFFGSEKNSWAFDPAGYGLEGAPEAWIRVFELDRAGSRRDCGTAGTADDIPAPDDKDSSEVFRPVVALLLQLRNLEPVRSNVYKNLQFMGKVNLRFRALLYDRDERALWLFGYWLGLLCRFDGVWWCDRRARRDYEALYLWLRQLRLGGRPGMKGRAWREMMTELEMAPLFVRC